MHGAIAHRLAVWRRGEGVQALAVTAAKVKGASLTTATGLSPSLAFSLSLSLSQAAAATAAKMAAQGLRLGANMLEKATAKK